MVQLIVLFFEYIRSLCLRFFLPERYCFRKQHQEAIPYQRSINIYDKYFGGRILMGKFTIAAKNMKVLIPRRSYVSLSR
ncbi:Hypothetical protein Y17_1583 [Pectobacterium wasabiae CFBP 3304]|nr:Hypothetical protein Y17_1583 [Pectobacterium wasabiae CFBP 3304]